LDASTIKRGFTGNFRSTVVKLSSANNQQSSSTFSL
jgi:hypothetical protein